MLRDARHKVDHGANISVTLGFAQCEAFYAVLLTCDTAYCT